jgi:hypothetical protein
MLGAALLSGLVSLTAAAMLLCFFLLRRRFNPGEVRAYVRVMHVAAPAGHADRRH